MIFASDNWSGAHPDITAALSTHGSGMAASYGKGELDKAVERRFAEIFETDVAVFAVATGTAANALSLAAFNRPGGKILCHREAHIVDDECGAPEFFTGGARIAPVEGPAGQMDPADLERQLAWNDTDGVEGGQPMAVSISQSSEFGTVYSLDEISRIADIAHGRNLPLHMDGARFANALVALGCSPAEMTWRRGVDVLSFGGTKNGCWCAEAVVFFDPEKAAEFAYLRKRGGQLFSKMRFVAAQFSAYFDGDLWMKLATHSNAMADRIRAGLDRSPKARQAWPTAANEIFAILDETTERKLREAGAKFYNWKTPHGMSGLLGGEEKLVRLVTSWSTEEKDVERFVDLIA